MAIQLRERIRVEKKTAALAACAVSKAFRPTRVVPGGGVTVRAVDCVSLSVWRGEIYGLLGANGSGKSTLIRLFSTLLTPDEGTVSIFGLDIDRDELAVKRLINRVLVEASFFKKLSAIENLVCEARGSHRDPAPGAPRRRGDPGGARGAARRRNARGRIHDAHRAPTRRRRRDRR